MKTSNPVDGKPIRVDIACDRGGWQRPSQSPVRKSTTSKTGCQWSGVAKALKANARKWTIKALHNLYNHETTSGDAAELTIHRIHRGLTDDMKAEVAAWFRNAISKPRDITVYLRKQFPDAVFIQKDIENYRHREQRDRQDGKTPTQTLFEVLQESGLYHVNRTDPEDPHKIIGLFWSYPWCLEMWKKYPWVLQMDSTYKTNRFNMPLFQATGVTNVSSTFNAA